MGMMGFESEGDKPIFAEINVTPLVDVMLVLLIIFMVTAPFMIETIGVDLPEGQGVMGEGIDSPLTISIDRNEKVSIAGQIFSTAELKNFLSESPRVKNGEPLFVEADKSCRHGALMSVMSAAYEAGAHKINIMMQQP